MMQETQAMWNAPLDGVNNELNMPSMAMIENDSAWTLNQANWAMFDFDLNSVLAQTQGILSSGELASMAPSSSDAASFGQKLDAIDMMLGVGYGFGAGAQAPVFLNQPHQQEQTQFMSNSLGLYGEPPFMPEHNDKAGAPVCPPPPMAVAPQAIFSLEDIQQYALASSESMARACKTPPPPPYALAPSPYASTPALSPDSGLSSDSDSEASTPCPTRIAKASTSLMSSPPAPMPISLPIGSGLSRSAPCTPARKPHAHACGTPRKRCSSARKSRKSAASAFNFLANRGTTSSSSTSAPDSPSSEEFTPGLVCYVCGYKQARIAGDRRSFRRHMETHDEFKKYVWRCVGLLQPDGTYAGGCGKTFSRKDALQRHLRSGGTDRYCMSVTDLPFPANMD